MPEEHQEPIIKLSHRGVVITLLGTAHVSQASRNTVQELLESKQYDSVAVELCQSRYKNLMSPGALSQMDIGEVIRTKQVFKTVAMLILSGYQQRVAEQLGTEPGAEMKAGVRFAEQHRLPLALIDREISLTLKRLYRGLSWWRRILMFNVLLGSLFYTEKVTEEEVEKLKQGRILEETFEQLPLPAQRLKRTVVDERDCYMAAKISEFIAQKKGITSLLVIVGAGHLSGIAQQLETLSNNAAEIIAECEFIPPRKRIGRLLPWFVVLVILAGFAYGFYKEAQVGIALVIDWILINGSLAGLGALIAAAHPATIITVFFAAPLTSINPTIGAGMVAAAVELYLRKPKVADFESLRKDVSRLSGWRHNRVARIMLIFVLSTIGSAIGTYVGGFHIYSTLINLN